MPEDGGGADAPGFGMSAISEPDSMGRTAGGAYMPLFGMCASAERRAGAGLSERNGRRRWLLKGTRGRRHNCHAVLAPPHFISHISQEARCMERQDKPG